MILRHNESITFGELLKAFRTRRRLTQQQLAEVLGLRRHTIIRWEQGDFLPKSKALVLELARHLHLDKPETRKLLEASLTALAPHWSVPYPRNPYFTGREEILKVLHTQLGANRTVALTQSSALHGLGGIGKTQIALEYAYRYALEYSAVFWIEAETSETAVSSLLHLANVLQVPEHQESDQQHVVAAVQRWLSSHDGWLLIWDNVEDLALLSRLQPATVRQGAILLTTRSQALGTLAWGLNLAPMESEEGRLFILRRAKVLEPEATEEHVQQLAERLPGEYAAAGEVVAALGGLPLALDQAGAYIEETGCGFVGYLRRYQQQHEHFLARRGMSNEHPLSVVATFGLVCQRVAQQSPAALELLRCCACLAPDAIPEELLLAGAEHLGPVLGPVVADLSHFDAALATLQSFSLVQRQPGTCTLSLHRLLQAVVLDRMTEAEREQWIRRVMKVLDAVFPEILPETESGPVVWQQCERLLSHAVSCLQRASAISVSLSLASLAYKTAQYLSHRAAYEQQTEQFYQQALGIWEHVLGPTHPQVAYPLFSLALLYAGQGHYEQAEPLYQRACALWKQTRGSEHPQVAYVLHALATLYREQGKYEQAEPLFLQALHIQEQALGSKHPKVAYSLNGLAILYYEQSNYQKAEMFYQRALLIWEHTLGPEHPNVARVLHNLATMYQEQGKLEQAESLYRRALCLWEQSLGSEHPRVAYPLGGLADLKREQGHYKQAEQLYQRALRIREQALGPEALLVGTLLGGLATLYREQGKLEQAEQLYQRALRIQVRHLGQQHLETAQTLYDLALFRKIQGNLSEASSLAERALQIRSQSLGDAHPKTLASRTLLAQLGEAQGTEQDRVLCPRDAAEHLDHVSTECLRERAALIPQETSESSPSQSDQLQEFLTTCCELHPLAWCRIRDLRQAYEHWTASCQGRIPLSRRVFAAQLKAHGCQVSRTSSARIWRGIRLMKKSPGSL